MDRLHLSKVFIILGILALAGSGLWGASADGAQAVVRVTLQSGETVKFEYDTFAFDWLAPSRIKEPMSCREYEISTENIEEIYFSGEFDNICENKKDWQVIVKLSDETVYRGFLHVSTFAVKGIAADSAEEKTIPFSDLKRIRFRR